MKLVIKWIKVVYALTIILVILFLGFFLIGGIASKTLIKDTVFVNSMALFLGALSLPGITAQLFDLVHQEKKKFMATTCCPNCKHQVELRISEES
ncbi:hypothetical protein [Paenibacillus herberti]|uniref:Uncharacterized protein n=1 Tax=Paenibacillus herberti TaxID=1619309 RepID=A0A229P4X1_9BACL|nr:hypothetical protein [Paenibacillus herberti]OXM17336.1 hypothetical protein CGZ75_12240 [Paenibacillus herberti]